MKILHLANHTQKQNGNVHAAIDLACAQRDLGHEVMILSRGGDFDPLLSRHGVLIRTVSNFVRPKNVIGSSAALRAAIRSWAPDVIHSHMAASTIMAALARVGLNVPIVTTIHNEFDRASILQGLGDRVIAVSRVVESAMRRRGIPPAKLVSILNGTIGSARQPLPAPAAMALRHPAVLFVGGLHPRKGVADLLEAFSLARETRPDLNLYLVGDGPHREDYHQMVRPADADNIHFVGSIADPRAYYYGADLFVLSSHADPAPLVISEAREAGLGVIATAVDGVPEMLGHGAAGVLVPPQQPTRLAEALLDAVRTPEALRELRARSQIGIEGMSINRVANETLATYEEVIARRTPR